MRRHARIVLFATAIAILAGLGAAPAVASDASQSWQQQLNAARSAKSQNDWDAANAAYARALTIARESFDQGDDRLARTLEEISRGWLRQWDKARAIEAQQRAIEVRQASDRATTPAALANALHALAKIHQRFGESELAEPLFRQALALRESEFGSDDSVVARLVRDLGETVADSRPSDAEAEQLLKRTVAIDETPTNHARVAKFYAERDEHDLALDELRSAIELEENRPMPRLSELVSLWSRMADEYLSLDLYADAESALLTALELREEHLGSNHPYLAFTLKKLATVYVEAERYVEAEGHLLRATALNEAAWGATNHRCGCDTTSLLEQVNDALGRRVAGGADAAGRESQDIEDIEDVEEDPRVSEISDLEKQAEASKDEGDIETAIATMREALALRQAHYGAESLEAAYGLGRVSMLLRDQRRYGEAAEIWQERMRLLELSVEPTDPRMMSSLGTMGLLTRMERDYEASDEFYRRELRARSDRGQNLKVARILEVLGNMNLSRPDAERAAADFGRAAERWEAMAGPDAPEIVRLNALYGRALIEMSRLTDAETVLTAALDREEDKRYPDASLLIQILQPLKTVFQRTDRADAAAAVEARLNELRELRRTVHPRDERVRAAEGKRAATRQR